VVSVSREGVGGVTTASDADAGVATDADTDVIVLVESRAADAKVSIGVSLYSDSNASSTSTSEGEDRKEGSALKLSRLLLGLTSVVVALSKRCGFDGSTGRFDGRSGSRAGHKHTAHGQHDARKERGRNTRHRDREQMIREKSVRAF
jgi:hypothetical protein